MGLFLAGALIGFIICAIATATSNYDDIQEAYNYGFEEGKKSGLRLAKEKHETNYFEEDCNV